MSFQVSFENERVYCKIMWVFHGERGEGCSRRQAEEERGRQGARADGGQFGARNSGKLECRRWGGDCRKGCKAEGSRTSMREQSCGCTYSRGYSDLVLISL